MFAGLVSEVGGAAIRYALTPLDFNADSNVQNLFTVVSDNKQFLENVASLLKAKKLGDVQEKILKYHKLKHENLVDSSEFQKLLNNKKRVELKLLALDIRMGLIALNVNKAANPNTEENEKECDCEEEDLLGEFGKESSQKDLKRQLKDAEDAIQGYFKKENIQFPKLSKFEVILPQELEEKVRKLALQRTGNGCRYNREFNSIKAQISKLGKQVNTEYPLSRRWCQRELQLINAKYKLYFQLAKLSRELLLEDSGEFGCLETISSQFLKFHRAAIALYPDLLKNLPLPLFVALKSEDLTPEEAKSYWIGAVASEKNEKWEMELHESYVKLQKLRVKKTQYRFDCLIQAERLRLLGKKAIYTRELLLKRMKPGLIRSCQQHIQDYKKALESLRVLEEKHKEAERLASKFPEAEYLFIQKGYGDEETVWQFLEMRSRIDDLLFCSENDLKQLPIDLPSDKDIRSFYRDCIEKKTKGDSSILSKAKYIPHVWVGLKVLSFGKAVVKDIQGFQRKIQKFQSFDKIDEISPQDLLGYKDVWLEFIGDMDEITRVLLWLQKKTKLTNDELLLKRQLLQASSSYYSFQNKLLTKALESDAENLLAKRFKKATSQALEKSQRDLRLVDGQLDGIFHAKLGVSLSTFKQIGNLIGEENSSSTNAFSECLSCKSLLPPMHKVKLHWEKARLIRRLLIDISQESEGWTSEKIESAKAVMRELGDAYKMHLQNYREAYSNSPEKELSYATLLLKQARGASLAETQNQLDRFKNELQLLTSTSMGGMGTSAGQPLSGKSKEQLQRSITRLKRRLRSKQRGVRQVWRKKVADVIFLQSCPLHKEACSILNEEVEVLIKAASTTPRLSGVGIQGILCSVPVKQDSLEAELTREVLGHPYTPNIMECLHELKSDYVKKIEELKNSSNNTENYLKNLYELQILRLKIEREKAEIFKSKFKENEEKETLEQYKKSLQVSRELFNQCKRFQEKSGIDELPKDHDFMLIDSLKNIEDPDLCKIIFEEIDKKSEYFTRVDPKEDLVTHKENALDAKNKFEFLVDLKSTGNFENLDNEIAAFRNRYIEQRDKVQKLLQGKMQLELFPVCWFSFKKDALIAAHKAYQENDISSAVHWHGRYLEALKIVLEKKYREHVKEENKDLKDILDKDIEFLRKEVDRVIPLYKTAYEGANEKVGIPPQILKGEIDKLYLSHLARFHDPVQFLLNAFNCEKESYLSFIEKSEEQISSDRGIQELETNVSCLDESITRLYKQYEAIPKDPGAVRIFAEDTAVFLASLIPVPVVDDRLVKSLVEKKKPTDQQRLEAIEVAQKIRPLIKKLDNAKKELEEKIKERGLKLAQLKAAKEAIKQANTSFEKIILERKKLKKLESQEGEIKKSLWQPRKEESNRALLVFGLHSSHLERHWIETNSFAKAFTVFQTLFRNDAILQDPFAEEGKDFLSRLFPTVEYCNQWYQMGPAHGKFLFGLLKRIKKSKELKKVTSSTEKPGLFGKLFHFGSSSMPVIPPDQIWKLSPDHALQDTSNVKNLQIERRKMKAKTAQPNENEELFLEKILTVNQALANAKYYNAHLKQLIGLLTTKHSLFAGLPDELKEYFKTGFENDIYRLERRYQFILKKHSVAYKVIEAAAKTDKEVKKQIFNDSVAMRFGSFLFPSHFNKTNICTPKVWIECKSRLDEWVENGCKDLPKPELEQSAKVWEKLAHYAEKQLEIIQKKIKVFKARKKELKGSVDENRKGYQLTNLLIPQQQKINEVREENKLGAEQEAARLRKKSRDMQKRREHLTALTDEKEIKAIYEEKKSEIKRSIINFGRKNEENTASLEKIEQKIQKLKKFKQAGTEIKQAGANLLQLQLSASTQNNDAKASKEIQKMEKAQATRREEFKEIKEQIDFWVEDQKKIQKNEQAQRVLVQAPHKTLLTIFEAQRQKAVKQLSVTTERLEKEESALKAHEEKTPESYLPEEITRLEECSERALAQAQEKEEQANRIDGLVRAAEEEIKRLQEENIQFEKNVKEFQEKLKKHKQTKKEQLRLLNESKKKLDRLNKRVKSARKKLTSAIHQKFTKKLQEEARELSQKAGLQSDQIQLNEDGTYSDDAFQKALYAYESDIRSGQCSRDTMWSYRDAYDSLLDVVSVLETLEPENCEEEGLENTYSALIPEVNAQLSVYERGIEEERRQLVASRKQLKQREPRLIQSVGRQLQERINQRQDEEEKEWQLLSFSNFVGELFGKSKYVISRYVVHPLVVDPILKGLSTLASQVRGKQGVYTDDILRATGSWELSDLGGLLIHSQGSVDDVKKHLSWDFRSNVAAVLTKKRALEVRLKECEEEQKDEIQVELNEVNRLYNFLFLDRILIVLHETNQHINQLKERDVQESDSRLHFLKNDKELLETEYNKYLNAYKVLPEPDRSVAGKVFTFLKKFAGDCLFLNDIVNIKYPSSEELRVRKVLADSGKTLSDLIKTVKEQLKIDSWDKFKESVTEAQSGFLEFSNNYPETAATTVNDFALTILIVLGKDEFDAFCTTISSKAVFWHYCKTFRGITEEELHSRQLTKQEELYFALAKIGPILPHAASFVRGAAESVEQRGFDWQNNLMDALKAVLKWRIVQETTNAIPEDSLRVVDAAVRIVKGNSFKSILRHQAAYEIAGMVKFVHTVMNTPEDGFYYMRDESLRWFLKIPAAWTIRKWEAIVRTFVQLVVPTVATTAMFGLPVLAYKGVIAGGAMGASAYGAGIFSVAMLFVYYLSKGTQFYTRATEKKASDILRGLKKWYQGEDREKSRVLLRLEEIGNADEDLDENQSTVKKELDSLVKRIILKWKNFGFLEKYEFRALPEESDKEELKKVIESTKNVLIKKFNDEQGESVENNEDFDSRMAKMMEFFQASGSFASILKSLNENVDEEEEEKLTTVQIYIAKMVHQELIQEALEPQLKTLAQDELAKLFKDNDGSEDAQKKVLGALREDVDDFSEDPMEDGTSFKSAAENYFKALMANQSSSTTTILTENLFKDS